MIKAVCARTAFKEPGSPWGNGYCAAFDAGVRNALLSAEIFYSFRAAQILVERW